MTHADSMLKDAWAKMLREAGVDLAVYPDVKEEEYAAVQFFICWDPPKEIFSKVLSCFPSKAIPGSTLCHLVSRSWTVRRCTDVSQMHALPV